ncbi:MAG: HEAT repeat domain-containing protein [Planctomycetota bacterium]
MKWKRWIPGLALLAWMTPCAAGEEAAGHANHPIRTFTFEERGERMGELYRKGLENKAEHIPFFLEALKDEDMLTRETAVKQLVFTHDDTCVQPLIAALHDESAIVRRVAIACLERIGNKEAIPALTGMLIYMPVGMETVDPDSLYLPEQEYTNRLAAALALSRLGSDAGQATVLEIIQTSQIKPVLDMALSHAMMMDMTEVIPDAIRIAQETPFFGEDTPGLWAIRAARVLDDGRHGPELAALAREKHNTPGGFIKVEILCLLSKYGDEQDIPLFKAVIEDPEERSWEQHTYWAVLGLVRLKPEGIASYLVNTVLDLDDRNPNSVPRYEYMTFKPACLAVGALGDKSVIPDLKRVLELYTTPTDFFVQRLSILRSLAMLGDPEGLAGLQKALTHEDAGVRRFAAKFLGDLDSQASAPMILEAIRKETEPYTFKTMMAIAAKLGPVPADVAALPVPVPAKVEDTNTQPRYLTYQFDDCACVDAMERFADLVEDLAKQDARWAFFMNYADRSRFDVEYNKVLVQRCFDRGCEIESHSAHHNPDVQGLSAMRPWERWNETNGNVAWLKLNMLGLDKVYTSGGGGGGTWRPGDIRSSGRRGQGQGMGMGMRGQDRAQQNEGYVALSDTNRDLTTRIVTPRLGSVDQAAPPFHRSTYVDVNPRPQVERGTRWDFGPLMGLRPGSDLAWMYDFPSVEEGVEAFTATFDYWYHNMPEFVFYVNGHEWPDGRLPIRPPGHERHWDVTKGFLTEALLNRRDRYPHVYSMSRLEIATIEGQGKTPEEILTRTRNLQSAEPTAQAETATPAGDQPQVRRGAGARTRTPAAAPTETPAGTGAGAPAGAPAGN